MLDRQIWIPFASINGSFMVIDDSDDALLAYHQSLAMVETLIDRKGERVIAAAVNLLRNGTEVEELLGRLTDPPMTGRDLLDYLEKLDLDNSEG